LSLSAVEQAPTGRSPPSTEKSKIGQAHTWLECNVGICDASVGSTTPLSVLPIETSSSIFLINQYTRNSLTQDNLSCSISGCLYRTPPQGRQLQEYCNLLDCSPWIVSSSHVLDEAERSLHDALSILIATVSDPRTLYGGGCCEISMAAAIDRAAEDSWQKRPWPWPPLHER
jgi:hypothetical protein